jgi:hypothetical protein
MSATEVRDEIRKVQLSMIGDFSHYSVGDVTASFLGSVNLLHQKFGEFVGKAKAKHPEYVDQIDALDSKVGYYFEYLTKSSFYASSFKLVNLAIGKICELLSFIDTIETIPLSETISRKAYDELAEENAALRKTIKVMANFELLPEINELLENARSIELPIDENWVLALCSANLIEAIVNKKLNDLGESCEGSFEARYNRLVKIVKEKEQGRDLQRLLPLAIYKGVRSKLDHASHENQVTPREAKDISRIVIGLMTEVFQKV